MNYEDKKQLILSTYKQTKSKKKTSEILGIPRSTVQDCLRDMDAAQGTELEMALKPLLKRGAFTLEELASKSGQSKGVVLDLLESLKAQGANVCKFGDRYSIHPAPEPSPAGLHTYTSRPGGYYKFGYVSDNHLCSKYSREDILTTLYDWFEHERVDRVLNTGNYIDGEARFNKHDIFVHGMQNQLNYFCEHYPQRDGIVTYIVSGDDHEGWYCFEPGVEILTKDYGWVLIESLAGDELVATKTPRGEFEWQRPVKVIAKDHHGQLIRFQHRSLDIAVTPDHRFEVDVKTSMHAKADRRVMTAAEIAASFKPRCFGIPRTTSFWEGIDAGWVDIPRQPNRYSQYPGSWHPGKLKADKLAVLCAWFATEGSTDGARVQIAQQSMANDENRMLIIGLLRDMGCSPSIYDKGIQFSSKDLAQWLDDECGVGWENKRLPNWVLELPTSGLSAVFDAMIRGDGHNRGHKKGFKFYSGSERLLAQMAEIAQKLGYTCSYASGNGCVNMHIGEVHPVAFLFKAPTTEQYSGKVFCVSVPNERIFVRKSGKTFWSLNCQREGVDIGWLMESTAKRYGRGDLINLGFMESFIRLQHADIPTAQHQLLAVHPGGGSAYATSYAPQKYVEALSGGEKPAVILFGHWHKIFDLLIRNVICLGGGCTKDLDPFGRKNKLAYHLGGMIVELWQDETGAITRWRVEKMQFFDRGYYNDQWGYTGNGLMIDERS